MGVQKEISDLVRQIVLERAIHQVYWIAAGGSYGGFYPANYFMQCESKTISTYMITSKEFVLATPAKVGEDALCVVCSMRGTKETCDAAQVARERGAYVLALYVDESDLTKNCDAKIKYESIVLDSSKTEKVNSSIGLCIAMTLVYEVEGYDYYQTAMDVFGKVDALYRKAVEHTTPLAKKWADTVAKESTIYVMGSGPAFGSAYIFSICNIEEMLQIDSPTVNSCEFFHGPFEVLDMNKPFFMLVSVGRCRPADERAVTFLRRYGGEKIYLLDGKEIGLDAIPDEVSEYFNHILFSPILNNVYMRALSQAIPKDYMTRRYMWKVAY